MTAESKMTGEQSFYPDLRMLVEQLTNKRGSATRCGQNDDVGSLIDIIRWEGGGARRGGMVVDFITDSLRVPRGAVDGRCQVCRAQ